MSADEFALLATRDEFPTLKKGVHLISHSLGAMPRAAREHTTKFLDEWENDSINAWGSWLPAVRSLSDIIASVGFQFMFGAPTPPPPPVAKAAPAVVEEPPPPPPPPPPPEPCHAPAGFQVDANCRIIEQTVVVRSVDFEFNSTQLTVPAQHTLNEVAAALQTQPELNVEVQGHTDSIGTDSYNLGLSQRRAEAVKAYLISRGLSAAVLTAKGFGKTKPIASNETAEGRAQNRRVAFEVTNGFEHVIVIKEDATDASTQAAKQGEPPNAKK